MLFCFAFYFSAVLSFSFCLENAEKSSFIGRLGPDRCLAVGLRAPGLDADALARALTRALEISLLRRLVADLWIRVGLLVEVPFFRVRFRRFFRLIFRFLRQWLMFFRIWSLPSLLGERVLPLSPVVLAMPGE